MSELPQHGAAHGSWPRAGASPKSNITTTIVSRDAGNGNGWLRCSRQRPCEICGRASWCGYSADGRAVRCMRSDEAPHGWRIVRRHDDGGVTFALDDQHQRQTKRAVRIVRPSPRIADFFADRTANKMSLAYWAALHRRLLSMIEPRQIRWLANRLGVAESALRAVEIGFADALTQRRHQLELLAAGIITDAECERLEQFARDTFAVPERCADGAIVGIATRDFVGKKLFLRGGNRGLIVPVDLAERPGVVLVPEGMSDVAACLTHGFAAIGRPANMTPPALLDDLAAIIGDRECIIIAERDAKPDGRWPGRDGARHDARELARRLGRPIRWAFPPDGAKDLREHFAAKGVAK